MPLVVKRDTLGFHTTVLDALADICPGVAYVIDELGVVSKDGTQPCEPYCTHLAGCNMVDVIMASEVTTKIQITSGAHGHVRKESTRPDAGTVYWNPTRDTLLTDLCGGRTAPTSVALAHELVHVIQDFDGTINDPDKEMGAVRGENQIRAEMCELPRVRYGADDVVADFSNGWLDDQDRMGCSCATREPVLDRAAREVRCYARQMLLCLLRRVTGGTVPEPVTRSDVAALEPYLRTADPYVARQIRTAIATRAVSPHCAAIEKLATAAYQRDSWALLVEGVGIAGDYGAVLMYPSEERPANEVRVVTNLAFGDAESMYAAGPVGLVEMSFATEPGWEKRVGELAVEPGVGGADDVEGFSVQFLTRKVVGSLPVSFAIYGYLYPAFDPSSFPADGEDAVPWSSVDAAYGLARELVTSDQRVRTRFIARRRR